MNCQPDLVGEVASVGWLDKGLYLQALAMGREERWETGSDYENWNWGRSPNFLILRDLEEKEMKKKRVNENVSGNQRKRT